MNTLTARRVCSHCIALKGKNQMMNKKTKCLIAVAQISILIGYFLFPEFINWMAM